MEIWCVVWTNSEIENYRVDALCFKSLVAAKDYAGKSINDNWDGYLIWRCFLQD